MHYLEMMKYQTSKNYRKYTEEGGRIDNARQKISNGNYNKTSWSRAQPFASLFQVYFSTEPVSK